MEYKFAGKSKAGGDTQKERQHSPPMEEGMTFDDIYMQRSSRFLDSVQELKNLRPQLYHAAEYFELSYFRNQQKRMVLHNSKDYAVKALVNAVDHVGSVASKLNDLLTQETDEISATELRIDCLKQGLLMCREHTDHKGITEQCLAKSIPRYHRHYVLPEAGISEAGTRSEWYIVQDSEQARLPPMRLGTSANRNLSWHLAGETWAAFNSNSNSPFSNEFHSISSPAASETFFLPEVGVSVPSISTASPRIQSMAGTLQSTTPRSYGSRWQSPLEDPISLPMPLSFGDNHRPKVHRPPRSKGLLSTFLGIRKSMKDRPLQPS